MITKTLQVFSLLIIFSTCLADSIANETRGIGFQSLLHDTNSGIRGARDEVIRDEATWSAVWDEVYSNASEKPPLPHVDFTHQMVVVAAMGEEISGGFNIKITRLVLRRGVALPILEVNITEHRPGRKCVVAASITSPIDIVVTGIVGDVTFRRKRVVEQCRR